MQLEVMHVGGKGGADRESEMPDLEKLPQRPEHTSETSWLGSAKFSEKLQLFYWTALMI